MSERLNMEMTSAPATNPSCTAIVSHDVTAMPLAQSSESCGNTAVPVNQRDIASNSARERSMRTRRGDGSTRGLYLNSLFTTEALSHGERRNSFHADHAENNG